jgi:elongation factor G
VIVGLRDPSEGWKFVQSFNSIASRMPSAGVSADLAIDKVVVKGTDEVHLEAVCTALCDGENQFVEGEPTAILLETIRNVAEGEGKYIRQTGGSGNYGHCKIRLSPSEPGKGYEFVNDIKNDVIPQEFIKPIDMGVREAMNAGILAGYTVVDVAVTLYDGSYHEADSNPIAFQIAGAMAFKEAAKKASPVLMEPVMAIEATVPEEDIGELVADINARRGRIESVHILGHSRVFGAAVPLRETLRSSVRGRLEYPMRFARYEPVSNPHDELGDDALGIGVRNPQLPNLNGGRAEAELYFELE